MIKIKMVVMAMIPLEVVKTWRSKSIKIGISIYQSILTKISKSDLIDIDHINKLKEIDDTLILFIDLS